MPQRQVNEGVLEERKKIVLQKYPNLYPFLTNLLHLDPNQRMSTG